MQIPRSDFERGGWEFFLPGGGRVSIEIEPPPEELAARAELAAENLDDMQIPLRASRDEFIKGEHIAFNEKVSPDGGAWEPWADSYAAQAAAVNRNGILERYGDLRKSATSPSSYRITKNEVFYTQYDNPFYGPFHQQGASRQKGGELPARPWLGISERTDEALFVIWEEWVDMSLMPVSIFEHPSGRLQFRVGGQWGPNV